MKISIAMATYNGAKYISAQLQSFLDQTRQPNEVVITDDRSSDNTVALIEEFTKTAPFDVRLLVNDKNLGYSGNFNAALSGTTGDLVFLSDQDDVWFPDKIERIILLAENNPDNFIYMNDALLTDGNLRSVHLTKYGQIKSAGLSNEHFVMGCCCAIRREYLNIVLPIPARLKAHDNWLVEIADGLGAKLIDSAVLQYYRRHGDNESTFFANSLQKMNLYKRYLFSLKRAFSEGINQQVKEFEQDKYFLFGLKMILPSIPSQLKMSFIGILNDRQEKVQMNCLRLRIRKKFFFNRIFSTLFLLFKKKDYKLTDAVRDLIA